MASRLREQEIRQIFLSARPVQAMRASLDRLHVRGARIGKLDDRVVGLWA